MISTSADFTVRLRKTFRPETAETEQPNQNEYHDCCARAADRWKRQSNYISIRKRQSNYDRRAESETIKLKKMICSATMIATMCTEMSADARRGRAQLNELNARQSAASSTSGK